MATLREIRKKLHSIENVRKITQAMEMVAGARLRRVQAKTESARPYLQELKVILNNLLEASDDLVHPLITARKEVKRIGLVVIAGDKGLCGAYNNQILSAATLFLQDYDPSAVDLFLVGQKACSFFDKKEWNIKKKMVDWGKNITLDVVGAFNQDLMQAFLDGSLDEVHLVYTHFHNIMVHKVMIEQFFPIALSAQGTFSTSYIFEPNEQAIFDALLPRYCLSKLQHVMHEAHTSELAARILAMRAATKNADEMANELTLERNKLRQTGITKELIEITSGAEASKSLF